jgi:hypothetical protein
MDLDIASQDTDGIAVDGLVGSFHHAVIHHHRAQGQAVTW